jgi:hypothetical protein
MLSHENIHMAAIVAMPDAVMGERRFQKLDSLCRGLFDRRYGYEGGRSRSFANFY